jgi:hypothetical protein
LSVLHRQMGATADPGKMHTRQKSDKILPN